MKNFIILIIPIFLSSCGVIEVRKKNSSHTYSQNTSTVSSQKTSKTATNTKVISKNTSTTSSTTTKTSAVNTKTVLTNSNNAEISNVLNTAKSYLGTPYRYGGTTNNGMDCSGLIYTSFTNNGIEMKRMSSEQAKLGKVISLDQVQPGDLLFFNTSGRGISHVGMVEKIENGEIFFIHSSTSKGVIISSLNEKYWKPKIIQANRLN